MPYEVPKMSLKQAALSQGGFTPIVYTPQTEDMGLLQRSLAQMEARQTSAAEKEAEYDKAAAQLQTLVNPAEKQWVYDYLDKQSEGFKTSIDSGDYGAAIRQATVAGAKLLSTPEAIGRIKAQQEYQEEVKTQQSRRDKGEIGQNTYDWWMSNNPYKYEDTYDEEGNIIGGTSFIAENRPVADINWAAQAQAAFKLITPYKNTEANQWSRSNANSTNNEGESHSRGGGSSAQVEKISKQDILDNIEELLSATPDGYRQAEQAYDVAKFDFEKMISDYEKAVENSGAESKQAEDLAQKIEERRKLMYKNGSQIGYKEYYARMITDNLYAEKLAYEWHTDTSSSTRSDSETGYGNNTPSSETTSTTPFAGATFNYTDGLWHGPKVRQKTDTESAQQGAGKAAGGINNRFKGNNK